MFKGTASSDGGSFLNLDKVRNFTKAKILDAANISAGIFGRASVSIGEPKMIPIPTRKNNARQGCRRF